MTQPSPIRAVPLLCDSAPHRHEYGSFGYPWALNHWSQEQLVGLFEAMQSDGIEIILLPISFGEETYFPSEVLAEGSENDFYGLLFDLAEAHDIQVILSGLSYTFHLQFMGQSWDPALEVEKNQRYCQELFERYGDRPNFWGWYIPHEAGDRIHRGDVMTVLRALPVFLKTLTPDKPVAFSPWFTSPLTVGADATTPAAYAEEWDAMLSEIEGLDICAIQDSTAPHGEIGDWFAAAAPVFKKHGVELWSVVELFHREPVFKMNEAISAERMLEKMQAAAPYVSGYTCWEYQNYLNPTSPLKGARELGQAYRTHFGLPQQTD